MPILGICIQNQSYFYMVCDQQKRDVGIFCWWVWQGTVSLSFVGKLWNVRMYRLARHRLREILLNIWMVKQNFHVAQGERWEKKEQKKTMWFNAVRTMWSWPNGGFATVKLYSFQKSAADAFSLSQIKSKVLLYCWK